MAALRTGVSMLSADDPKDELVPTDSEAIQRTGRRLVTKLPTVLATYERLRQGEKPVGPTDRPPPMRRAPATDRSARR